MKDLFFFIYLCSIYFILARKTKLSTYFFTFPGLAHGETSSSVRLTVIVSQGTASRKVPTRFGCATNCAGAKRTGMGGDRDRIGGFSTLNEHLGHDDAQVYLQLKFWNIIRRGFPILKNEKDRIGERS